MPLIPAIIKLIILAVILFVVYLILAALIAGLTLPASVATIPFTLIVGCLLALIWCYYALKLLNVPQ